MAKARCVCGSLSVASFLLGATLLIAGLVVVLKVFPNIVNDQINDGKVLGLNDDGTLNSFTDSWVNSHYISTMEYWVYNYTNTIGVMNRAIFPDMMEKGPYAYDEIITMDRVNFSENGEFMQFRQIQTFVFNPAKSCAGCDPKKDKVLIPDIGFQVGIDQVDGQIEEILKSKPATLICEAIMTKRGAANATVACHNLASLIEGEIGTLISLFNTSPFVYVTVDELLFSGYTTPFLDKFINEIIDLIHSLFKLPFIKPLANPPIQLNALNGTSDTLYTVYTGKTDPLKAGYITEFSSIANLTLGSIGNTLPLQWWPSANASYCLKNANFALRLDGTNADFFKNFVKRDEPLPVFISDLCRSADLVYDRDVTVEGITGYRFVIPATAFNYSTPNDENCGFCVPLEHGAYEYAADSACLPSGLLDISGCTGAPIIVSKPHFYQADHLVERFVPRFKANYDSDETVIDIEPNTGTVLRALKKLQINVLVNQFKHIRSLSVMRPGAYPLVWLTESFYMDQKTKDQLNSQLFGPVQTVSIICWCAVGLGGGLLALSIATLIVSVCCFRDDEKKDS